jgi:aspartate beta-hydroxylase
MNTRSVDAAGAASAQKVAQAGMTALRAGNPREAIAHFGQLERAGLADSSVFIGLALGLHKLGQREEAHRAVDQALLLDGSNVNAFLVKADMLAQQDDARGASSFYLGAIRLAEGQKPIPPELAQAIDRARAYCEGATQQLESAVRSRVSESGVTPSARFKDSIDYMFGHKKPYLSMPRQYYFPDLKQVEFFEHDALPWVSELEAATPAIKRELHGVLNDETRFSPYLKSRQDRAQNNKHQMVDNAAWSACYLIQAGKVVEENANKCPETMRALSAVPLAVLPDRSPSVLFSLLRPGAHIPPHNGLVNTRLIGHLPLIVPQGCEYRVGNSIRQWEEGKVWLFDDTVEHEAWNTSDTTRVILLFEVWRPELSLDERRLITEMFTAVDAHRGEKPDWEI